MGSPNVYTDISEYIKHRKYDVLVPSYTASVSPYYLEEDENGDTIIPPFNPASPLQKCMASLSIGDIINYREKDIPVTIVNRLDLIDMYVRLDDYMTQLRQYNHSERAINYLIKANRFLTEIYDRLRALAFDDPGLKPHVEELRNKLDDIFAYIKIKEGTDTYDDSEDK